MSLREGAGAREVRVIRRNDDGKAPAHRHVGHFFLRIGDSIGHFLGTNVGTPLHRRLSQLAVILFVAAVICAVRSSLPLLVSFQSFDYLDR